MALLATSNDVRKIRIRANRKNVKVDGVAGSAYAQTICKFIDGSAVHDQRVSKRD